MYTALLLQDGQVYENNGVYFRYYTEEQFAPYKNTAILIGGIELIPRMDLVNENETLYVQTQNGTYMFKIEPIQPTDKIFGYIYAANNTFVAIVEHQQLEEKPQPQKASKPKKEKKGKGALMFLPIIIVLVVIMGIVWFMFNRITSNTNTSIPVDDEQESVFLLSDALVEVPVYVSFELGSQETINLNNPDSNDVTFKYEVYNGDTMLFSTDTISPGEAETVVLGDYLASGEYELVFNVRCFLNGSEVNGLEEPVTVTIK
jgi:hypothetical protein